MKNIAIILSIALAAILLSFAEAKSTNIRSHVTESSAFFSNTARSVRITSMIDELGILSKEKRAQVLCLAMNIYYEAGGSTQRDRWAVGLVTLNRLTTHQNGDTICDVVWEDKLRTLRGSSAGRYEKRFPQFSWTGEYRETELADENAIWDESQMIAYQLFVDPEIYDFTRGRRYFYNPKTASALWMQRTYDRVSIGNHVYARVNGS